MAYHIDLKYLKLIPLDRFTEKGDGKYNFRCPVCGDSSKDESKKRGWALTYDNTIIFKCFNCNMQPLHISQFLQRYYPELYTDYIKESFQFKSTKKRNRKIKTTDVFSREYEDLNIQKIVDLPEVHAAVKFLKKRKLTEKEYSTFYYTDNFYKWVHEEIDSKYFNFNSRYDPRIVIPFYNKSKKIFAIQGRTILKYDQTRYITVKTSDTEDKLFGLERIDFSKKIYVVEGPIDSLFLPNCLALAGSLSNLDSLLKHTIKENLIIVPDNDKRNRQTNSFINESLQKGYKTVLWPYSIQQKDINDFIISDFTREEVLDIINSNIYSGLLGIAKFKMKRK